MENPVFLIVACVFAALALVTGHFWPLLDTPHNIKRYIYGTATLYLGFCIWRLSVGDWQTPLGLAAIIVCGGLANMASYAWDDYIDAKQKVEIAEAVRDDPEL